MPYPCDGGGAGVESGGGGGGCESLNRDPFIFTFAVPHTNTPKIEECKETMK